MSRSLCEATCYTALFVQTVEGRQLQVVSCRWWWLTRQVPVYCLLSGIF